MSRTGVPQAKRFEAIASENKAPEPAEPGIIHKQPITNAQQPAKIVALIGTLIFGSTYLTHL